MTARQEHSVPVDGPTGQVQSWLDRLQQHLQVSQFSEAMDLFRPDALWRDLLALSWNIVTQEGRPAIHHLLAATAARAQLHGLRVRGVPRVASDGVIHAWFDLRTAVGEGIGQLRLQDGRCLTLFTSLRGLRGHEEPAGARREAGTQHEVARGRFHWIDQRDARRAAMGKTLQPQVLIVGGGQGGLALAARLKRLGVGALIVERHARPGDAWRHRYHSLCLHDPVWYDHLPYLPFPDHWPVYTPKDRMADWLEAYCSVMDLDFWGESPCRRAQWDPVAHAWQVEVERAGQTVVLKPRHLVLATGMSGFANRPNYPGLNDFQGQQHHSSEHPGGEGWAGRRCIVVGSNNSAHDIAADLWEHGAQVTLLQRSATLVVRAETLARYRKPLYSEEALAAGIDTDLADLTVASLPARLATAGQIAQMNEIRQLDAAFYEGLERAGFALTFGEDGSGLSAMYARRGSGYYIDVGGSDLIAQGQIALRSGAVIQRVRPEGIELTSGEILEADLIVWATGYGSMSEWAAHLISPEVAHRVGPCWGLGSGTARDPGPWEGELRNMWKPVRQPGLWFHGGNLAQSRHYSLTLALQLKARLEGMATPVYGRMSGD